MGCLAEVNVSHGEPLIVAATKPASYKFNSFAHDSDVTRKSPTEGATAVSRDKTVA